MLRQLFCALVALILCVGVTLADEIKGKIKSVDAEKNTITVTTADGKDQTFSVGTDTKFLNPAGKDLKDGIKAKQLKADAGVTVTTEKKDGKDVVTKVALAAKK